MYTIQAKRNAISWIWLASNGRAKNILNDAQIEWLKENTPDVAITIQDSDVFLTFKKQSDALLYKLAMG